MKMRSILAVAIVFGYAASTQASTIVYDVNAAALTHTTTDSNASSPTFGPWTLGYKDATTTMVGWDVSACTPYGNYSTGSSGGTTYNVYANSDSTIYYGVNAGSVALGNWTPGILSGGFATNCYTVLRWKAPSQGVVDIAATVAQHAYTGDQDVHVVLGTTTAGSTGTALYSGVLYDTAPSLTYSGSSIAVNANSVIDLVIGRGPSGSFDGDYMALPTYQISFTAVPEPSSIAIIGSALIGLLAYAWRKRG